MKNKNDSWIHSFLASVKAYSIALGVIMSLLGVALASYLSHRMRLGVIITGLACILLIQVIENLINLYRDQINKSTGNKKSLDHKLLTLAFIAIGLMLLALLVFILSTFNTMSFDSWLLLITLFVLIIVKSKLFNWKQKHAYMDIIEGIILVFLIPGLSFSLLAGELHRFLPMVCLPLLLIYWASNLALAFPLFANDVAKGKNSILIVLGWQTGRFLHDMLLLLGFLAFGFSSFLGLPWLVIWPTLLALPIGIFEIWQMYRLSQGYKPNWKLLKVTSFSLFLFPAYSLIISLFQN